MNKDLINELKSLDVHKIVPFNSLKDTLVLLDFSENNTDLTDPILLDNKIFTVYTK
jgi:hypothetical protein